MNIQIIENTAGITVLEDRVSVIEIVGVGPQGPAGAAANSFNFTQSTPQSVWTINHNLGYFPNVNVFSVGGLEIVASVAHLSNNTTEVSFTTPTAGTARLS
jgi:hypothetical protein